MKRLVFIAKFNTIAYFLPLALYISKTPYKNNCVIVTNKYEPKYKSYYKKLAENGIKIISEQHITYNENDVFFVECVYVTYLFNSISPNITVFSYVHSTDDYIMMDNVYNIYTDKDQLIKTLERYNAPYETINETTYYVPSKNATLFLGGFFHYFELADSYKKNRSELKIIITRKNRI